MTNVCNHTRIDTASAIGKKKIKVSYFRPVITSFDYTDYLQKQTNNNNKIEIERVIYDLVLLEGQIFYQLL